MNVTINTDASFCHETRSAAFAVWITTKNMRIKKAGILKEASNSQDAEIKAIANAVHILTTTIDPAEIDYICFNSDCKTIFDKISLESKDEVGRYIAETLRAIADTKGSGIRTSFKHVRAHTGDLSEKRNYVNDWCDRQAKIFMRIQRKKVKRDGKD